MKLNLERPLLFFDIESTGLNIATDSIIELSFVKVFPDSEERIKTWKVCPWDYVAGAQKHISESASSVNGVHDQDVKDCPKFYEIVDEVVSWLKDSDLAGFNSAKFDLPILAEEIERVREYCHKEFDINLHEKRMIDVQTIYHVMEPRNLKAAYRFYCHQDELPNAHTAEADTVATYEVLKGQLDAYPDTLRNDVGFLSNLGGRPKNVDYAGRLVWDSNSQAVISFGKHKGKTAREVYQKEPSYFAWIMQGEFTLDTKRQFALLKEQFDKEKKAEQNRQLSDQETAEAIRMLQGNFQGRLF